MILTTQQIYSHRKCSSHRGSYECSPKVSTPRGSTSVQLALPHFKNSVSHSNKPRPWGRESVDHTRDRTFRL